MQKAFICFKNSFFQLIGTSIIVFVLAPTDGQCQMIVGDPSLMLNNWGDVKVEIGAGLADNVKIKVDALTINLNVTPSVSPISFGATTDQIDCEQYFMRVTTSLGKFGDVFGVVGQGKIKSPISGDSGVLIGGGIRLSPPQPGLIKIGIVLQALQYSSEETYPSSVWLYGSTPGGLNASVYLNGNTHEKITLTNYNAVLGFGFNAGQYIRPYAGLLISIINGTDDISFSGTGQVNTWPSGGGAVTNYPSAPASFSASTKIREDSSVNGIVGLTLNPAEQMGITLEAQFGNGLSYFASGSIRF